MMRLQRIRCILKIVIVLLYLGHSISSLQHNRHTKTFDGWKRQWIARQTRKFQPGFKINILKRQAVPSTVAPKASTNPALKTTIAPQTRAVTPSKPSIAPTAVTVNTKLPSVSPTRIQNPTKSVTTIKKPTDSLTKIPSGKTNIPVSTQPGRLPDYTLPPTKDSHVKVPDPVDVIPVRTVPTRKYVSASLPTPLKIHTVTVTGAAKVTPTKPGPPTSMKTGSRATQIIGTTPKPVRTSIAPTATKHIEPDKQAQNILPVLPVFNVTGNNQPAQVVPQPVKPVSFAKDPAVKDPLEPVEPKPVMTRPTATVTQRVVSPKSAPTMTSPTLQSVVVPKIKGVTGAPVLGHLGVLPPYPVQTPMPVLKPHDPIPPKEPFIWFPKHEPPTVSPCNCDLCGCSDCQCPNTGCSSCG